MANWLSITAAYLEALGITDFQPAKHGTLSYLPCSDIARSGLALHLSKLWFKRTLDLEPLSRKPWVCCGILVGGENLQPTKKLRNRLWVGSGVCRRHQPQTSNLDKEWADAQRDHLQCSPESLGTQQAMAGSNSADRKLGMLNPRVPNSGHLGYIEGRRRA